MIVIDLSKQHALDANTKLIQQIDFKCNLENNVVIFFISEEPKETVLDFLKGIVKAFWFWFLLYSKMTQYNTLKVKLPNSQLNKLK